MRQSRGGRVPPHRGCWLDRARSWARPRASAPVWSTARPSLPTIPAVPPPATEVKIWHSPERSGSGRSPELLGSNRLQRRHRFSEVVAPRQLELRRQRQGRRLVAAGVRSHLVANQLLAVRRLRHRRLVPRAGCDDLADRFLLLRLERMARRFHLELLAVDRVGACQERPDRLHLAGIPAVGGRVLWLVGCRGGALIGGCRCLLRLRRWLCVVSLDGLLVRSAGGVPARGRMLKLGRVVRLSAGLPSQIGRRHECLEVPRRFGALCLSFAHLLLVRFRLGDRERHVCRNLLDGGRGLLAIGARDGRRLAVWRCWADPCFWRFSASSSAGSTLTEASPLLPRARR